MLTQIIIITIASCGGSFVLGYFLGYAVRDFRAINDETEDPDWDLPPIDDPLPYRITDGYEARQELIRNSNPDEA
jgi:hypothetical protein